MQGYRTFGVNFVTIICLVIMANMKTSLFKMLGLQLSPEDELALLGSMIAGVNMGLRWFTKTPIFKKVMDYGKEE